MEWESGIEYISTHIRFRTLLWIEYNFYPHAHTHTHTHVHTHTHAHIHTHHTHMHTHTHTPHTHTHTHTNMRVMQVFNTKENGYHFYDRMFGRNLLTADSAMQGIVYPSILLYMSHILMLSD